MTNLVPPVDLSVPSPERLRPVPTPVPRFERARLDAALSASLGMTFAQLSAIRPHLLSELSVRVSPAHLDVMAQLARLFDRVTTLPAWQARVLAQAPEIARFAPRAAGVFLGYDFHLSDDGPKLIEINTNAGGGLLNALLQRAWRIGDGPAWTNDPSAAFVEMFLSEWRLARGDVPLKRIAVVDEAPEAQFLRHEFELFRRLFESHGIAVVIADARELVFENGWLSWRGKAIDLVYNRLTDFSLDTPACAALREAYLNDAVVLTPHPRAHALFADKRNLVALSDPAFVASLGLSDDERRLLARAVPRTEAVTADNAPGFWETRRRWFFKPAAGFGGKAAYRGGKVTRRVFESIAGGGYVAQEFVRPSECSGPDGQPEHLKIDVRNYVYRGHVQLVAARLYRGQTTNFRTPGGGFAVVCSAGPR